MNRLTRSHTVPFTPEQVRAWTTRPGWLERQTPPWQQVTCVNKNGAPPLNGKLELRVKERWLPPVTWVAQCRQLAEDDGYVLEQARGPFAAWRHDHRFTPTESGGCTLTHNITYRLPFGILGQWLNAWEVRRNVDQLLAFRQQRMLLDLTRQIQHTGKPMKIAVTGASGLVGQALCAFLTNAGHEVWRLVRHPARRERREIRWDPDTGKLNPEALEGMDAVIHLAGENIAAKRWSAGQKTYLLDNRRKAARLLSNTLAQLDAKPKTFLVASAVGFYGNRGDDPMTEASPVGTGFPADICQAIESATEAAESAGIRTVHMRLGVVLAAHGGALARMLPAFRLGLGGRVGSGNQMMSWIALEDVIGAINHLLVTPKLRGPVNLTAPNPVANADFALALGRSLKRPAILPLPAKAVTTLFGEMGAELLLKGAAVMPDKLTTSGFNFAFPDLPAALAWELHGTTTTEQV